METKKCNICKIRAYIKCEQCSTPTYFCSRGHLYSHKMKCHRAMSANHLKKTTSPQQQGYIAPQQPTPQSQQVDMRKLFEHLQSTKKEIILKMSELKFDITVQATIESLVNIDTGEYKVRYNGNIFSAFANDLTYAYKVGDNVFLKIPEGNNFL